MIFLLRNHVTVKMINENTGKQKKTPGFKDRTRINLLKKHFISEKSTCNYSKTDYRSPVIKFVCPLPPLTCTPSPHSQKSHLYKFQKFG